MPTDCITYQKSGYYTKIIVDYLNQESDLKPLYNRFPSLDNFKNQIQEKAINYNTAHRDVLVSALTEMYKTVDTTEIVKKNIKLLNSDTTFTITTGHQLNLFTGPLYFLYKIISTINLCKQLEATYPTQKFVPIYWMATEDHDFEEINYFNFKDKKIKWTKNSAGPVGRLATDGLEEVFRVLESQIGGGTNASYLKNLFKNAYLKTNTLAEATLYLANELFKNDGLVILDADSVELKKQMIPFFEDELLHQSAVKTVTATNVLLNKYSIQVTPREINLFYIDTNLRERIILENAIYKINNTNITFSRSEIIKELHQNPEKFSPNVILRPLYQEVILPNLAYIGGGGEIAYWLQLKSTFEWHKITFPILILRNSALLISEKQKSKIDKLPISMPDLFLSRTALVNKKVKELTTLSIDFSAQKAILKTQFEALQAIALQTDASFIGAVKAQEIKQIKGLLNLEKRLLKAEKRVHKDLLNRIIDLQESLFPNESLQERNQNFSEFYIEVGPKLIETLRKNLDPLAPYFSIITV